MLGRKDNRHENLNFVYLLGANDLNPKLKTITDSINNQYPKLELDYSYDTADNFLYSASDQASFVKRNIPAIFYFNGLHNDYHKTTDTPDKIDYEAIKKVSSLIFLTAIELANQE
jgi:Peptidase family M28.